MSHILGVAIVAAISGLVAIPLTTTITGILLAWGLTPFFAVGGGVVMLSLLSQES
ncbi:MAG: hypothetical protein F6J86_20725 [Symploca sp. SIO1B1]|nr:hypothetical protein [Symploca sp. SIO1B1]